MNVNPYHSERVNQNLLDNWYFGNPVNQRGQTEYTNIGYTIDRWNTNTAGTTVKVNATEKCVEISAPDKDAGIYQKIEFVTDSENTVTLSVLAKGVGYLTKWDGSYTNISANDWTIFKHTYTIPAGTNMASSYMPYIGAHPGKTLQVKAAKLEEGDRQTLAYQDSNGEWKLYEKPDYKVEMLKCQRYQFAVRKNSGIGCVVTGTLAYLFFPIPVQMKTTPKFIVHEPKGHIFASINNSHITTKKEDVYSLSDNVVTVRLIADFSSVQAGTVITADELTGLFDANL